MREGGYFREREPTRIQIGLAQFAATLGPTAFVCRCCDQRDLRSSSHAIPVSEARSPCVVWYVVIKTYF